MKKFTLLYHFSLMTVLLSLAACTNLKRLAHSYSASSPSPQTFTYSDTVQSTYYDFFINHKGGQVDTFIFLYGGSGCASWKYVMPDYLDGLTTPARVFALNKRYVKNRSTGLTGCGKAFHLTNTPRQWIKDYREFIQQQLKRSKSLPRNIILIGISEGVLPTVKVAKQIPAVTQLVIIGDGAYSMRKSLTLLKQKYNFNYDIDQAWKDISNQPTSIDKKWLGNPYYYWSSIMDIDPLADFLSLNIPVMLAMGENDTSVPVESARFLESEFNNAGKDTLTLTIYPNADHQLKTPEKDYKVDFFTALSQSLEN